MNPAQNFKSPPKRDGPRRDRRLYLVALVFGGAFLIDFGKSSHFFELIGDAAHLPLFCFITLVFAFLFRQLGLSSLLILSVLAGTALAALIEIVQPYFGRSESAQDLINGSLGACIGGMLFSAWETRSSAKASLSFAFAILASVYVLWPAWEEWKLVRYACDKFPVLSDFEHREDLELWAPLNDEAAETEKLELLTEPRHSLKISSLPGRYSGAEFRFIAGKSWSAYSTLSFEIENPGMAFQLEIRIDDFKDNSDFGSRFNRSFSLAPGLNRLEIPVQDIRHGPINRELDIEQISRLMVFTAPQTGSRSWFLDELKLE